MEFASKKSQVTGISRLAAGSKDERSWRFHAKPADLEFTLFHPDIALAILKESFLFSQTGDGAHRGCFRGLEIEWEILSASIQGGAHRLWSLLVGFSTRFPPVCARWQLEVSAQVDRQGLIVHAHLQPPSGVWAALWLGLSHRLWREVPFALVHALGSAAERLAQDFPEELLRALSASEQRELLKEHLQSRFGQPQAAALLSLLEVGDQMLIRFQTAVPRPRRGQEALDVGLEIRDRLLEAFERLAQAGSAFSTLRGEAERRVLGRDLHERLIRLGRELYTLYIPKGTHGHLTSLLDAARRGWLKIEVEGRARSLPWELLHNGEDFLSLLLPVARTPVQSVSVEAQRFIGSLRRVLLVVPESDLTEALPEMQAIYDVLVGGLALSVEVLAGREATKEGVVRALQEGAFDVLHYSGHSRHDPGQAGASHLTPCASFRVVKKTWLSLS